MGQGSRLRAHGGSWLRTQGRWRMAHGLALVMLMTAALHATRAVEEEPCAPARLTDTGLYAAGRGDTIAAGIRAYSPQYPLWSDGATKARWIYLPPGTAIDTSNPGDWTFPVGTRFWKEFRFNGRKVETRFLWRATADHWVFATYAWNAEGTDAVLAPEDGLPGAAELAPGKRHDIPGANDCRACHGSERPGPLGFNALQLSDDRDPNAIHGEPLAPGMLTLATLANEHLLAPARPELVASPPRIRTGNPRTRAVLGYFAANCGTCHNRAGDIAYAGPSLKHSDLGDGDAVARALLAQATAWQLPGHADGTTHMLDDLSPDASAMLARMRSRRPSSQMPPLGTVLRDEEAIAAVANWIATDLVKK
jgi:mono/diheme cytochrome c family protein